LVSPQEILNITLEVRKELGYTTDVEPKIVKVYFSRDGRKLYIICGDRSDRSVFIGPGGRVVYELKEKLGVDVVIVRALTDIIVRRSRIVQAVEKARRISLKLESRSTKNFIENSLIPLAKALLKSVDNGKHLIQNIGDICSVTAFSGGFDSATTLVYAKMLGLRNFSITVDPGPFIVPDHVKQVIINYVSGLGVKHAFVKPRRNYGEIIEKAKLGFRVPCKMCHEAVEETVIGRAVELGAEIVLFGDLLPTGYHSIRVVGDGIIRINLPAFMALTKTDTIITSKLHGLRREKLIYGCPLLRYSMRLHRHFKYVAIQRVLRETRAGVLEPNQALELVKSILQV